MPPEIGRILVRMPQPTQHLVVSDGYKHLDEDEQDVLLRYFNGQNRCASERTQVQR